MKSLSDIPVHVGAPDEPGWWVLRLPTREPFLMHLETTDLTEMGMAWQDAYACWPLDEVVSTPRITDLLTRVGDKPLVLWELSQCFARVLVAGPWTATDTLDFGHHTQVPDGRQDPQEPVWGRSDPLGHGVVWVGKIAGDTAYYCLLSGQTPRLHGTLAGAKAEADRLLRARGFHLIDLA